MLNGYLGYLNNSIKFMFLNLKKKSEMPFVSYKKNVLIDIC